jgi:hypothetical protein
LLPTLVTGNILSFRPRVIDKYGTLEVEGGLAQKNIYSKTNSYTFDSRMNYTSINETMNIGLNGFSYHPNFIEFFMNGTLGASQNRVSSNSSWGNSSAEEYELRAKILPRHRYNLELFAKQERPLLLGNFTDSTNNVVTKQSGATLNYIQTKWSGSTNYLLHEMDNESKYKSEHYNSSLIFRQKALSLSGNYGHSDTKKADDTTNRTDIYSRGSYRLKKLRLGSGFTRHNEEKWADKKIISDSVRKQWKNNLHLKLPWNLGINSNYNKSTTDSKNYDQFSNIQQNNKFTNENQAVNANHHLFQSLQTNFSYSLTDFESSGGETTTRNKQFSTTYRKKILGRYFIGTYTNNRNFYTHDGKLVGISEKHNITATNNNFTLNSTQIDKTTITITVSDPDDVIPDENLIEGTLSNFTVDTNGDFVEIFINTPYPLPGGFTGPIENYDYIVTYDLIEADYEIGKRNDQYSLSTSLFNEALTGFYSFSKSVTTHLVGDFISATNLGDATTSTYSLRYKRKIFSFGAKYTESASDTNQTDSWNFDGNYTKKFKSGSELVSSVQHWKNEEWSLAPNNTDTTFSSQKSTSGSISFYKTIPEAQFTSQYMASYTNIEGISNDGYSFLVQTNLKWIIGKTSLSLNAKFDETNSESDYSQKKTTSTSIYLNMQRKIF